MKPCKTFKCTDLSKCNDCYNGQCTGIGYDASKQCGCDFCEYSRYVGDEVVCAMKTYVPTKKISDLRDHEEYHDWPEHNHKEDI